MLGCAVAPFYYRRRPWKAQTLSEAIQTVLRPMDGLADAFLHPQIAEMLTEEYAGRWQPRESTEMLLLRQLTGQYAARTAARCGEAVVLLGEAEDAGWQMKMTWELFKPYLPRINRMLLFYEETAEYDMRSMLGDDLDDYYYEYGLVPQTASYIETKDGFRCGKERCNGVILDYGAHFRYPKIGPDSTAVYIDAVSEAEKEGLLHRKTPQIPYVSPLKYLDTMVKNSYDRLVN